MRRYFFLSMLAVGFLILTSCDNDGNGKEPYKPTVTKTFVNALSFNIRHTGEASDTGEKNWDVRKDAVVNMIKVEKPDIVGLQEATDEQISYLTSSLSDYDYYSPGINNKCILYRKDKFTKLKQGQFWHSDTPNTVSKDWGGEARSTVWVKLKEAETGKTLFFFSTHLNVSSEDARVKSAPLIVGQMQTICGVSTIPQILCGDMNTDTQACLGGFTEYLSDTRAECAETDSKHTFNAWGGSGTSMIDHMYHKNLTPLKFRTIDGQDYGVTYISDHYPIMGTFILK